jgi:ribokinase|tara:strand:+ start:1922 stop:2839 length:918 start_codon:yes stop_codon:yes gene_type:complete
MAKVIVAGLINIETSVKIEGFPLNYGPVHYPFNGIKSTVSGCGYNITKALTTLGNKVKLLSVVGQDLAATQVRIALEQAHISSGHVIDGVAETPQSVILYDENGKRQIHCDLKTSQDWSYPVELIYDLIPMCDYAVVGNNNYLRGLLPLLKEKNKTIITDVHTLSDIHDDYNRDFLEHADVVFLSHECVPGNREDFVHALAQAHDIDIVVMGMGSEGAMVRNSKNGKITYIEARAIRDVVSSVGAGDALLSGFVHALGAGDSVDIAIKKATLFAGYKVGDANADEGFLNQSSLEMYYNTFFSDAS